MPLMPSTPASPSTPSLPGRCPTRITALAGGIGGARFLRGLRAYLDRLAPSLDGPVELTIIGNTGDDIWLHGLRVSPDLDTLLYTLGGGVHEGQGWGRADETFAVQTELLAYGSGPDWFGLGDRDFATHIMRSRLLAQGDTLSQVTARLADRWGLPEQHIRLLPMTDQPVETHVIVPESAFPDAEQADSAATDGERAIHFQEWWVRHQAALPASRFVVAGLDRASAAPGVLDAIRGADLVVLPPSNPVVSIGIILLVPGVREALRGTSAPVVGISPIVAGRPVRGHADACLDAIGVETSAAAVAGLYADFLDGWLVADSDDDAVDTLRRTQPDLVVEAHPLLMSGPDATEAIAAAAVDLGVRLAERRRDAGPGSATA